MPTRPVIALAVALVLLAVASPASAALTPSEQALLRAVNATRASRSLPALRPDATLTRAARAQSRTLLAQDVLAHGDFAARLHSFGATYRLLGENLAWASAGAAQARAIVGMWLKSAPHRENLLRPSFRRVGVGTAVGEFRGYGGSTVVTADFAG